MAAPHPALPPNPHAATDAGWMRRALAQAELAAANDEIPIGAVVVLENRLIGQGYNQTERLRDVTAHAEMLALTAAANTIGNKYLLGATLYCTVEPCPMCAGALAWAQVARVVFGVRDEKRGLHCFQPALLHPRTQVTGGILADECAALMQAFFRERR
ncbi:MAG: nucleoside deaminase [Hymenobacteraceae bacterium]|nr:nucleoside deaminase [Hymenobacteraceae bacterium]